MSATEWGDGRVKQECLLSLPPPAAQVTGLLLREEPHADISPRPVESVQNKSYSGPSVSTEGRPAMVEAVLQAGAPPHTHSPP